jgi:hypothetical protein
MPVNARERGGRGRKVDGVWLSAGTMAGGGKQYPCLCPFNPLSENLVTRYLATVSQYREYDVECGPVHRMRIGRGSEVLGENPPQCYFVHQKSNMT